MVVKVYADNDVISTLRRQDPTRPEYDAIVRLKALSDSGEIEVLVSRVHDREAAALRSDRQQAQHEILALFPNAVFVEDQWLEGFNTFQSGGSMFVSPHHEENPTAQRLWKIGLDRTDAHHVMLAIENGCAVFATCDRKTILKYRAEIENKFPIRLLLPSEFVQNYPA